MLGAWLPAACIVLYIEFHCVHGQMVDLTAFIKLPGTSTVLICSDDDDGECSCNNAAPFAKLKLSEHAKEMCTFRS